MNHYVACLPYRFSTFEISILRNTSELNITKINNVSHTYRNIKFYLYNGIQKYLSLNVSVIPLHDSFSISNESKTLK